MFLADYLLKQMSLGYKNSRSKFDYPYELKEKGWGWFDFQKKKMVNLTDIVKRH